MKILDLIADKLTLIAVVICLAILFLSVWPIVIILMSKDILMLIGGAVLLCMKIRPPKLQNGMVRLQQQYFM